MPQRRIGILGFDSVQALDLVGPADVFGSDALAAPEFKDDDEPPYEVVVIGVRGKKFTASNGVQFTARYTLPTKTALDTLIVPGGSGLRKGDEALRVARWIAARAAHIRRIATVCTGIYGLAPTGLLDGREVATHWAFVDDLQRRFPKLRVDRDALFRKDSRFYTSAGITAGIDLALAMVERRAASRRHASVSRASSTNAAGETEKRSLNARANWRTLRQARRASASTDRSARRFAGIHATRSAKRSLDST